MSEDRCKDWNGQYDDPPPSYSLVVQQEPPHVSVFQVFPLDVDLPPSYSSLDLSDPTSNPSISINQSSHVQENPKYTTGTRIPRGWDVPSYIGWSILNIVIFPPIGLVAFIISLKVCIARRTHNADQAWKYHVIARKVNIAASSLGIMAGMYYAIAVPLMFAWRSETNKRLTSVSRLGRA